MANKTEDKDGEPTTTELLMIVAGLSIMAVTALAIGLAAGCAA